MALGMVSSTMIGLIFVHLVSGELAYSTVLSIVVSFIVAFFIGRHFGLSGIIEAFGASFMGAMMGAMLGDMIPGNRQSFMMIAMDIIYVATVISFMLIMNNDADKEKRMRVKIATPLLMSLILSLSIIGLAATIEGGTPDVNKKTGNPCGAPSLKRIRVLTSLRVSKEDELMGLDISFHEKPAYSQTSGSQKIVNVGSGIHPNL